jgi:hypothetical protein
MLLRQQMGRLILTGQVIGKRNPKGVVYLTFLINDQSDYPQTIDVYAAYDDEPEAYKYLSNLNINDYITLPVIPEAIEITVLQFRFDESG